MQNFDIYNDIARRTGGDIYLGVVSPLERANPHLLKSLWNCWLLIKLKIKIKKQEQ